MITSVAIQNCLHTYYAITHEYLLSFLATGYFPVPPHLASHCLDKIPFISLACKPLLDSTTCPTLDFSISYDQILLTGYNMYRLNQHTLCNTLASHPSFSTAPAVIQPFSVNETTARPILLNNITCAGTETRLTDCLHNGIGIHNCSHTQDAAVSCPGPYCYSSLEML